MPTLSADQVLSPYVWVFYTAFIISFIATPVMRKLALANGIVDWPDLRRKAHVEPVAYLGGVGIFLGWVAGIITCFALSPHNADGSSGTIFFPASILIGGLVIMGVGLIDDVWGLSPRVKVGGQLLAAALLAKETVGTALAAGVISSVAGVFGFENIGAIDPDVAIWAQPTYWVGAVIVAILVLGGCNAVNLLDGLDGLASGVVAIAAIGFLFISTCLAMGLYGEGGAYSMVLDPVRIVMCLAMLGAIVGFLPYNFNPANIFMGDAGSLFLGYLSVTMILLLAEPRQGEAAAGGDPRLVMAGLIVLALPILDTSLAIVRRKMRGQPIFSPDNQHLHHQLIRSGLSVKQAVLLLYLVGLSFAAIGGTLIFMRLRYVAAVFMVFFGFAAVMAYKIGHRQHLAALGAADGEAQAPAAPDLPTDTKGPGGEARQADPADPDPAAASDDADAPQADPADPADPTKLTRTS